MDGKPVGRLNKKVSLLCSLLEREEHCWNSVRMFLENRDPHGVMDMGAELQALQRARLEIEKLED